MMSWSMSLLRHDDGLVRGRRSGNDSPLEARTAEAFARLHRHGCENDYTGWEFDDFLASPLVRRLAGDRLLTQRIWIQVGEHVGATPRRLLGVPRLPSTKARGFFARGYVWMYEATAERRWLDAAEGCLDWLLEHASERYAGMSWGNHFDFATRGGHFARGLPTVVWTAHIAEAFGMASAVTGSERYGAVVESAADFVYSALERHHDERGWFIEYSPGVATPIHNSNLLGAVTLLEGWARTGREDWRDAAAGAFAWTLSHQRSDGAWYYGVGEKWAWIDSFHTAYVLESLIAGHELVGESMVPAAAIDRTYHFWVSNFFGSDGAPSYYEDKVLPYDIQCAAQAIETFSRHTDRFGSAGRLADDVVRWTLDHMQKRDGAFRFRIGHGWRNDLESLHWGQATMCSALGAYARSLLPGSPGTPS
jgi:hypothetical protein